MVTSSLRVLIGDPPESTAEMDTALLESTLPETYLGTAVLTWLLTVPAFEPVPSAFAGILSLKASPMSEFVNSPPEVGVTVSCRSGFIVNPEIADSVIVCALGLFPATVTVFGPPSEPIEFARTVHVPFFTEREYAPAESVCATANPPPVSCASTKAPETPALLRVTVPEIVWVDAVIAIAPAAVAPETVSAVAEEQM